LIEHVGTFHDEGNTDVQPLIMALRGDIAAFDGSVVAAPVAVSFFFVLSGFVLTINHIDASPAMTTSWRSFFRARAARVLPVYWLALLIAVPTALTVTRRRACTSKA
jgi:peptidoglycan/LPS O-acetylase OafA/YrhL